MMNEFTAASKLQALFAHDHISPSLSIFKDAVKRLLSSKLKRNMAPGLVVDPTTPSQSDWGYELAASGAVWVPENELAELQELLMPDVPLHFVLHKCNAVTLGSARYQPASKSKHNSPVLFRLRDGTTHAGVIHTIFREPEDPNKESRTIVRLKRYTALTADEAENDCYGQHPVLGKSGYDVVRLYHDSLMSAYDAVFLEDIVSQLCTCTILSMDGFDGSMIVTMAVDKASRILSYETTARAEGLR